MNMRGPGTWAPARAPYSWLDDRAARGGEYLKQQLKDKLIERKQYINKYGQDLPEARNWKWSTPQ